jgi:hypothetical protein
VVAYGVDPEHAERAWQSQAARDQVELLSGQELEVRKLDLDEGFRRSAIWRAAARGPGEPLTIFGLTKSTKWRVSLGEVLLVDLERAGGLGVGRQKRLRVVLLHDSNRRTQRRSRAICRLSSPNLSPIGPTPIR